MNRLHLVVYPLRDVLFGWKQIGDMLGEDNPMLLPELFYETNQRASDRAAGGGRRTLLLHVSPAVLAPHLFLDIWLGEQMLEIPGEIAFLVHVRCQEGNCCSLHFSIGHGVHELSLRLMRNVGPTCGMVGAAH